MTLRYHTCIFDLDGTLTQPGLIDFAGLKQAIGCPPDLTIIEYLETRPGPQLRAAWRMLDRFERAGLAQARANHDTYRMLATLRAWGIGCYVLTRNSRAVARTTLHSLGLRPYITDLVCREDAEPKPAPAGIRTLQGRWGFASAGTLMVGDFRFDVLTGAAAGVATAYLTNRRELDPGETFPAGHPTHVVRDLASLLHVF